MGSGIVFYFSGWKTIYAIYLKDKKIHSYNYNFYTFVQNLQFTLPIKLQLPLPMNALIVSVLCRLNILLSVTRIKTVYLLSENIQRCGLNWRHEGLYKKKNMALFCNRVVIIRLTHKNWFKLHVTMGQQKEFELFEGIA